MQASPEGCGLWIRWDVQTSLWHNQWNARDHPSKLGFALWNHVWWKQLCSWSGFGTKDWKRSSCHILCLLKVQCSMQLLHNWKRSSCCNICFRKISLLKNNPYSTLSLTLIWVFFWLILRLFLYFHKKHKNCWLDEYHEKTAEQALLNNLSNPASWFYSPGIKNLLKSARQKLLNDPVNIGLEPCPNLQANLQSVTESTTDSEKKENHISLFKGAQSHTILVQNVQHDLFQRSRNLHPS